MTNTHINFYYIIKKSLKLNRKMEKPSRGNLFDDDSDENDIIPKKVTEPTAAETPA